nr:ribonuclease H-like domain-containing protein [Tanacetum cinerariifolium]
NDGYVAFGGNPKGGKISGKGKIRTGKLDFNDVYFVKELKFNLFSVLQMHVVPTAVLTQSKLVPITVVRPVTTVVPKPSVTRPRQAKIVVTKPNSPPRRHINRSPSPKGSTFPLKVTDVKAPMVNAAKGV